MLSLEMSSDKLINIFDIIIMPHITNQIME